MGRRALTSSKPCRRSFGFLGLQGLAETTATSRSGFEVRGLEVSRLSERQIARCKIGEALALTACLEQQILIPHAKQVCFIITVRHRRGCLKLEGCTCTNTYLPSRNCTCSPECPPWPDWAGMCNAHWSGRSNTSGSLQPTDQDRPTPAGAVPGHTPAERACPMDDAVPSPPRRSQLHTAPHCVGSQASSTSGVPTVLCSSDKMDCCLLPFAISCSFYCTAHPIPTCP